MNRLWVRLSLSFALVTAVAIGVVAILANQRAGEAFRVYLAYSDTPRHDFLLDSLTFLTTQVGPEMFPDQATFLE